MKPIFGVTNALLLAALTLASNADAKGRQPTGSTPAPPADAPVVVARDADIKHGYTVNDTPGIPNLWIYPRVSGSTSTIPVGQLLAARVLRLNGELRRLAVDPRHNYFGYQGSTLALVFPIDADGEKLQEYSALSRINTHHQTSGSYMALAKGQADLILVAREPSADELATAKQTKTEFDVRPVALDALIFIANAKNRVSNLSLEQIRGIYSGKITNWNEVGGNAEEIFAVTRDRNSGSQELMQKLVMKDLETIRGSQRMAMTMGGTLDMAERRENSLAFSVFYYERIMAPRATLKPLAIEGVLPTSQTIGNRTYPLIEPVYVVTRKDIAPDGPAAKLRNKLLPVG